MSPFLSPKCLSRQLHKLLSSGYQVLASAVSTFNLSTKGTRWGGVE